MDFEFYFDDWLSKVFKEYLKGERLNTERLFTLKFLHIIVQFNQESILKHYFGGELSEFKIPSLALWHASQTGLFVFKCRMIWIRSEFNFRG